MTDWWATPAEVITIPPWLASGLLIFAAVVLLLVGLIEALAATLPESDDDYDRRS